MALSSSSARHCETAAATRGLTAGASTTARAASRRLQRGPEPEGRAPPVDLNGLDGRRTVRDRLACRVTQQRGPFTDEWWDIDRIVIDEGAPVFHLQVAKTMGTIHVCIGHQARVGTVTFECAR